MSLKAIDKELDWVKKRAEAPREVILGCSIVSHERLGFCAGCTKGPILGDRLELMGWRLLALRDKETGVAEDELAKAVLRLGKALKEQKDAERLLLARAINSIAEVVERSNEDEAHG